MIFVDFEGFFLKRLLGRVRRFILLFRQIYCEVEK